MFEKLTQQQLIDKINKIMALAANNPNEEEAASAAAKAQALLAEYNLTHADLDRAGKQAMSDIFVNDTCESDNYPWRVGLAAAVSQLYFCGYFYRNMPKYRRQHVFIGQRHHTDIAKSIFEHLCDAVNRLAREGAKTVPKKEQSPYRATFRPSASMRLQNRLIRRKRAAEQGEIKAIEVADNGAVTETSRNLPALLSTYKQEEERVESFMEQNYKIKKTKVRMTNIHAKGAEDGRRAGETIGLDPQIGKGEQRGIAG